MCPERVFQLLDIKGYPAQGSPVGGQLHWASGKNQKAELACELHTCPACETPQLWPVSSGYVRAPQLKFGVGQGRWSSLNTSFPGALPALSIMGGVLDAPDPPLMSPLVSACRKSDT